MNGGRSSLRLRLLLGTLVWILGSIGLTGWLLNSLFSQHLTRQFHAELQTHLNQLAAGLEFDEAGRAVIANPLSDPRLVRPYSGLYWQVDRISDTARPSEVAVLRSRSLWDQELAVPDDRPADGDRHEHRVAGPDGKPLLLIEQVLRPAGRPDQTARLIVAADEELLAGPLLRFRGMLLTALGLLAAGLVGAAIVQVRSGLRPLNRLRDELAQLRDGSRASLGGRYPSEVQPVVDELNAVLARNAEFVERARSQAGNLAHAVKTPLSVMANAAAAESGPLAELVGTQVVLARQQIDHHLARARAAAAAQLSGQRCRLRPALDGLLRVMQRLHADRHLQIAVGSCPEPLVFRGEAQDLQEMLGNLLDNAGKWATRRIEVSAAATDNELRIDVDDDGPGIAAGQRAELLQRGVRGDEQVPGSGLGLAIVDDLARLYGGRLELLDAPLGGLRVRLWLPAGRETDISEGEEATCNNVIGGNTLPAP
ncbi:MAG: ATP-binding protein [Betaproteobacteria bacterium HGW-Betaproteobacteria-7]|jgi:signal transduction histidine kinase|nr:MAG: ATP-binding protein [Betaproteobacteria bacterium HGW-Betaproteobacteria-7]